MANCVRHPDQLKSTISRVDGRRSEGEEVSLSDAGGFPDRNSSLLSLEKEALSVQDISPSGKEGVGLTGGRRRRRRKDSPPLPEWQSASLELWLGGGGAGAISEEEVVEEEDPFSPGLVYRNSVRIMVRPEAGGGGGGCLQQHPPPQHLRSSSEERREEDSSSSSVVSIKRKESLGVMQRAVVKEQFR